MTMTTELCHTTLIELPCCDAVVHQVGYLPISCASGNMNSSASLCLSQWEVLGGLFLFGCLYSRAAACGIDSGIYMHLVKADS